MLLRYWRLILFVLVVVGAIYGIYRGIVYLWGGEKKVYQVLVTTFDDKLSDPEEDKKSSMKKGYVVGVYPEDHQWSESEKLSYLILKMKLSEKEVRKITEPIEEKVDIKTLPEEQQRHLKDQKKENKNQPDMMRTLSTRKYKIDLEEIKFSDMSVLLNGQPYADKVFGWGIVEKTE